MAPLDDKLVHVIEKTSPQMHPFIPRCAFRVRNGFNPLWVGGSLAVSESMAALSQLPSVTASALLTVFFARAAAHLGLRDLASLAG